MRGVIAPSGMTVDSLADLTLSFDPPSTFVRRPPRGHRSPRSRGLVLGAIQQVGINPVARAALPRSSSPAVA